MAAESGVSLRWKIGGVYTVVMFILGLLLIAALYQLARTAMREQLDKRALAIATNFSDAAASHIVSKNLLSLHALAAKYTLFEGVAYVYINDTRGEVIAHTLSSFPQQLREGSTGAQREPQRRTLSLQDKTVYETSIPILDGQAGTAHVGFWSDAVDKEVQSFIWPMIGVIALVPIVGAALSFVIANWIVRPIIGLTEVADKVTKGDLEMSIGNCVVSRDEIGELARSLERMRSSLRAAMLRLNREAT
ncbi:MAG TPA: HAMP domain-containing protein [Candidatus Binatia bacterium]|nr:HAMP domain-containing protein [Candidatus Binatia bacterium]HET9296063.1 HAMP domain-containing protein [Candidatus Binatia bacterium]